jgi:simple sugar transport system permease protein
MSIRARPELYLLVTLAVLCLGLSTASPEFLTPGNLLDLLRNYSLLGVLALGELVVLISGGIDVSFMAVATVAQYVMGSFIATYQVPSAPLGLGLAVLVGMILGIGNALLISATGVHPVIVTIATLNLNYGILIFITGGRWIHNLPVAFLNFGQQNIWTGTTSEGTVYGLSNLTIMWFGLLLLTWWILKYTTWGRWIYAMGGNPEAARRAGIDLVRTRLLVYGYMGGLSGVAAFIQTQLTQMVQTNALVGRELDVLAAAILGGASITGGSGTVWGAILGVLIVAVIRNGLILLKVSSYWHEVVIGCVLAIAAAVAALYRLRPTTRGTRELPT